MAHNVIMPQMGESIAEGTVTKWLKQVGETVQRDEPLFEVSTDKVDAEIPSPASGTLLEIKVDPGKTVAINTVVAIIGDEGDAKVAAAPTKAEAPSAAEPEAKSEPPGRAESALAPADKTAADVETRRRRKSSPLVRKIAKEHGVNIAQLSGTGLSGRVTKQDIQGFLAGGGAATQVASAPSVAGALPDAYRPQTFEGDRIESLSTMRAKIAEHMVWSRRVSAHVQTVWEADFSHVDALRRKHKDRWQQQHGINLTFTAFVMKATVDALKAFPILNASLDQQRAIYHRDVNLGVAVALDWGLIVPVIHNAGELNLLGLARHAADLGERARTKKLKPEEVQRGTFTITNPGVFGNLFGLPVINQPQVGILGVGGIEKRPVVIDDMIAIRTRAYLSLSFDHRLVDGAVADQFMAKIKQGIQEFDADAVA